MNDDKNVLLVPGTRGGTNAPWMMYSSKAAETRDATVHRIEWEPPAEIYQDESARREWVRGQVTPRLDAIDPPPLLIGKSLGSHAADLAAERGLPAIWLTPLLDNAHVVARLRAATAPFLLIGGTADWAWDGEVAAELTTHVRQIPGADHGFFVPGEPLSASAHALGVMATAVEGFLDEVWRPVSP